MATIYGQPSDYDLQGTEAADVIHAENTQFAIVNGRGGDDLIYLGSSGSSASGGEGNDVIDVVIGDGDGGDGDDVLISRGSQMSSSYNNVFSGGGGNDLFVLYQGAMGTTILEMANSEKIDLSNLPNASQLNFSTGAAPYGVWFDQTLPNDFNGFRVFVNWDGTGDVNFVLYIINESRSLTNLTADHFIFNHNTAPVASDLSVSGSEDAAAITGQVSATDGEGDALTYSVSGNTPDGLTFNSDGSFSYVPQAADQALNAGESRDVSFDYTANDGTVDSAVKTVTITVQGTDEVLTGDANANILIGSASNDIITGLASGDLIIGGAGKDTIYGSAGADTVNLDLSTDGADQIDTSGRELVQVSLTGAGVTVVDYGATSSSIVVSDLPTSATAPTSVTLTGLSHTFLSDLDIYLTSPTGERVYLMSDGGGGNRVNNINLEFQDNGTAVTIIGSSENFNPFQIGPWRPFNNHYSGDTPDAVAATQTLLSGLAGDPNGTWTLHVVDDTVADTGSLASWSLNFDAPIGAELIDTVNLSGADQIRLSFTSSEVGNGNTNDSNTQASQDGGLAVRIQAEDTMGALTGGISRSDDEGVMFVAAAGTTLDVRDLVSGVARGDQFNVAVLGTNAEDVFDHGMESSNYYINAGQGNDVAVGGSGNDFLVGGAGFDVLIGGDGDDRFIGGSGNDSMIGGAGTDIMNGGTGDDTYQVDDGLDIIQELAGEGRDTVLASISYRLGAELEVLTMLGANLIGTGNVSANILNAHSGGSQLRGGGGNDTLNGAAGNDLLDGGVGADLMSGGLGDDQYMVNLITDQVLEMAGAGTDTVISSVSYTLSADVENLTLATAGLTGTGNVQSNVMTAHMGGSTLNAGGGNDILNGAAGNDLLDGGTGIDLMTGGAGNDVYRVGTRGDKTIEMADGGIDTVESTITWNMADQIEKLTLVGTDHINGVGNSMDNSIIGNSGNNTLDGRLGMNYLMGGAGDDSYVLARNYAQNTIMEDMNGGMDTVLFGNNTKASQVWFSQVGDDLQASVIGIAAAVVVKGWYSTGMSVESFRLSNGSELQANEVQALVDAMAGFTPPAMGNTELSAQYQAQFGALITSSWN